MFRQKKRSGFTLIELLVVIAIISILAGMLLPSLQRAREVAKRAKCGNNIRQIALAIRMYASCFGDSYPTSASGNATTQYEDLGILYPDFVSDLEVFVCASSGDRMPRRTSETDNGKPFRARDEKENVSYAYGLDKSAANKAWTESAAGSTVRSLDMTVPRAISRISAISAYFLASRCFRTMISLSSCDSLPRAFHKSRVRSSDSLNCELSSTAFQSVSWCCLSLALRLNLSTQRFRMIP